MRAWQVIAASLLVWFVIDSIQSAYLGYWPNIALNSLTAASFLVPLAIIRLSRKR